MGKEDSWVTITVTSFSHHNLDRCILMFSNDNSSLEPQQEASESHASLPPSATFIRRVRICRGGTAARVSVSLVRLA